MAPTPTVTMHIEQSGEPPITRHFTVPPPEEALQCLSELAGTRDVTVAICMSGRPNQLLLAMDGDLAFIGMDTGQAVYQYSTGKRMVSEPWTLFIGGQATTIEDNYVVTIPTAIEVVRTWLTGTDLALSTEWERQ